MKLGILTFHSQLNYGGVLQCWALKTALEGMGHEVAIVDRWLDPKNKMLNGPFGTAGLKGWIKIVLRSILGCGDWRQVVRHWRTRKFVRDLGLTPYHFYDWKDAPKDLGVDCVVVGSDQVWHGGDWAYPTPDPYLLNGTDGRVPRAIAFAASFGMKTLPGKYNYVGGFGHFAAISVREKEGIELVRNTGYVGEVVHVVDPTLLIQSDEWKRLLPQPKSRESQSKTLTCYFLRQDMTTVIPILKDWARNTKWRVNILCASYARPVPRTVKGLIKRILELGFSVVDSSNVRICTDYGPKEFLRAFAEAEATVTDSFHAVMFSSIFGCNCRFLRPMTKERNEMFARIEEFEKQAVEGPFLCDGLKGALQSFAFGEKCEFNSGRIAARRTDSLAWLKKALKDRSVVLQT